MAYRAHLYYPIVNRAGDLQDTDPPVVRILEPGTTTPISERIYQANTGVNFYNNPMVVNDGILDCYFVQERRVKIGVKIGTNPEVFYELDALKPTPDVVDHVDLRAPDGTTWRLSVDNQGVLITSNDFD